MQSRDLSIAQSRIWKIYLQAGCEMQICRQECDVDVRTVRRGLRLLRHQQHLSLDEIPGLDRSTVHRIENVKGSPGYSPSFESVAHIVEACGYTLWEFFRRLDGVMKNGNGIIDVLDALQDEAIVKQVQGFLALPEPARRALAASGTRNLSGCILVSSKQRRDDNDGNRQAPRD